MINLHKIVRGAITSVHADETVLLYKSAGQQNIAGAVEPVYNESETLAAQIQSESDDALYYSGNAGENEITRRFYLYADSLIGRPAGIIRTLARGGDLIYRQEESTWWLITAVIDDFSRVGWVCVRANMQIKPADYSPALQV